MIVLRRHYITDWRILLCMVTWVTICTYMGSEICLINIILFSTTTENYGIQKQTRQGYIAALLRYVKINICVFVFPRKKIISYSIKILS